MEKGLVSIIVPVYKTEKYLDRCINSLVNQTYRNLEIILVDDGSPDNCPTICDQWARRDNRIKVKHKQNQGLGMARNTGIYHATGEYICFFDSDDFVRHDTIEKLYMAVSDEQIDVAVFGFNTVDEKETIVSSFVPNMPQTLYWGKKVQEQFLPELIAPDPNGDGKRRLYMSAWIMLFSADLVHRCEWRFVSEREIISEDVYSLLQLFAHVRSVKVISEDFYSYQTNPTSISRSYRENRYQSIKHFYAECLKLCASLNYSEDIRHRVSKPYLANTLGTLKQEMAAPLPLQERKKQVRAIIDDDTLQQVLAANKKDKVSIRRKIMFFVMRNKLYGICCFLLKARS